MKYSHVSGRMEDEINLWPIKRGSEWEEDGGGGGVGGGRWLETNRRIVIIQN